MNRIKKDLTAMMMLLALAAAPAASSADGIEVKHLGVNNTLVRVTGDSRYLLLPVQESTDDARINILVDGNVAGTIYVRLAKSKTDYTVPFDLTPYKGHEVMLDVVIPQSRGSVREAKDDACWRGIVGADTFDTDNREKYRPAFHHTPLYAWMNDPNGMFYKDGRWHLYYQYNPYGSKWQNMTWGHSVSSDLVNWEHLPEAIRPNGLGAVFSGSCAVDHDNTAGFGNDAVIALYTSAGTSQMQSLASSTDGGLTFNIYPSNPVLTLESEARDPKVFWNDSTKEWNMILAHALDHEMLILTSPDMKSWTLQSSFGKGLGAQGGVWECPDLFELPVAGTDEKKWVLLCNINPDGPFGGSGTQYFVGDFDGKTFKVDAAPDGNVPTKWLDYGKDHYATVTWSAAPDGRRVAIGWMSNWQYAADVPTMQFRSANTLPRDMGLFRANGGICEIMLDVDASKASMVNLVLSNNQGEKVMMQYDPSAATLSFDRTESGITDFSEGFPTVTVTPTQVFGNNGEFVMTNLVFPRTPYTSLSVSSDGGNAKIENLRIYSLSPDSKTKN